MARLGRLSMVLIAVLGASLPVLADVRLLNTWDLKAEEVKSATGLYQADADDISVLDRDNGSWWRSGANVRKQVLGGKGGPVVGSEELSGLARLRDGRWLVLSDDDEVAVVFNESLQIERRIGSSGSALGTLKSPMAIAVSANERIYIADKGNDRISVFAVDGGFLYALGSDWADEKQRLDGPVMISVDGQERSYVLDRDGRLSVIAEDGRLLRQIDQKQWQLGGAKPAAISAMTADSNGLVYLADEANAKIVQFDWEHTKVLDSFGSAGKGRGQFAEITGLHALSSGQLAVLDSGNRKIETYQLKPATDVLAPKRLAQVLMGSSTKNTCQSLRVGRDGERYCLDLKAKKISKTSDQGTTLDWLGGLTKTRSLSLSTEHVLLIEDSLVKVYDRNAKLLGQMGRSGTEDGAFRAPKAAISAFDRIWVADTGNHRVQAFTQDGVFLAKTVSDKVTGPAVSEPVAIAADSRGNIFVADGKSNKIKVFNRALELQYELDKDPGAVEAIVDLQVDADDQLYALVQQGRGAFSLRVYNGRNLVLRFGQGGEAGAGLLKPTALSVQSEGKTDVFVQDEKRASLQSFALKTIPLRVGGFKITGSDRGTQLRWQPAPERFVSGYRIYAWREGGTPEPLIETKEPEIFIGNDRNNFDWFALTAITGHGVESDLSQAWTDRYATGRRAFEAGDYASAEKAFAETAQAYPDNADAWRMWGRSLSRLEKIEEALLRFETLAALPGQTLSATQYKLEALVAHKRYLEARRMLEIVLAGKPNELQPYWWCAEINTQLNDPVGAISCLEEIVKREPRRVDAKLQLGKTYIAAGAVDMGMAQLDAAQALAPEDNRVLIARAQQVLLAGRQAEALALFEQALTRDSQAAEAQLGAAQANLALGQLAPAKSAAISLAAHPQMGYDGTLLLGQIALQQKQPQEALLAFSRLLRGDNKPSARVWRGMADVYVALNQSDKELEALRTAVTIDDAGFEDWLRLGRKAMVAQQGGAAVEALTKALTLAPRQAQVLTELARAELQFGQLSEARGHVQQALAQNQTDISLWQLQASIAARQGKLTDAIESVKRAEKLQPDAPEILLQLATLYLDTGQYELVAPLLDKALALRKDWGQLFAVRAKLLAANRQYDKAVPAAEKALALEPSEDHKSLLNTLLAERKRGKDTQQSAPTLVLSDLQLKPIFSASYKVYGKQSIGSVKLRNSGAQEQRNLRVRFEIKGYMDFPYSHDVASLAPKAVVEIPLFATFNNQILGVDEDAGVQVEVAVGYQNNAEQTLQAFSRPTTLYGKNAILWSQSDMVGAFVTPRDDVLRDYVRQTINTHLPAKSPVNANMLLAMTYFSSLSAQGLRYQPDPNSPYAKLASDQIDYVQFPRETLRLRSGDCDDLSVLLAAGLENLGVETALVDVPGHLFLVFNAGVSSRDRDTISLDPDLVLDIDGQAWVPLESTLIATTFSESWAEGARKFRTQQDKKTLKLLPLRQAWQVVAPVTLPAGEAVGQPLAERASALVSRERDLLLGKSVERLVEPYRVMLALGADSKQTQLQIAIQYGKAGLYDKALQQLDGLLHTAPQYAAAHVAMGNVYYLRKDYGRALDAYGLAERLEPDDAGIKINLALSHYGAQKMLEASAKYREAIALEPILAQRYDTLAKLLSN